MLKLVGDLSRLALMICKQSGMFRIPAIVLATALGLGAASAQDGGRGFLDQLFGNSDRVAPQGQDRAPQGGQMDQTGQVPPGAQNRLAQSSGADLTMRMERLEATLRQLTGAIEQLQYRNQQLEGQLRRMQEDTEYRFQNQGAAPRTPARPAATPPANQPPSGAPPGKRGDAFDPSLNPNAPGAPRTLGSTIASVPLTQGIDVDDPVGAPGGRQAGAPLDLSSLAAGAPADAAAGSGMSGTSGELPSPPPRNSARPALRSRRCRPPTARRTRSTSAYGYILRKDYALAEDGFRGFLQKFPNDRVAPDAQYWLGESLFQRQRFRDAAESFLNVSTKYDTAAKAPDALLRLGQSLAALGEKEAACASLGEVLRKYPRASVSVKQGVDREQKRVHC